MSATNDISNNNANDQQQNSVNNTLPTTNPCNDDEPYSLDYILQGFGKAFGAKPIQNDQKNDIDDAKITLPFQNKQNWIKIQTIFKKQSNEFDNEIKYLQYLFKELASHPADKFVAFLSKLKNSNKNKSLKIYKTFFGETLPFMIELILYLPNIFNVNHNLMQLTQNCNKEITLTRGQIACLLASCFFSLVSVHCDFACELNVAGFKGKFNCWIHYFEYVRLKGINHDWFNKQTVTVYRRSMNTDQLSNILSHNKLVNNNTLLTSFKVNNAGSIEDEELALHADFANEFIGGGVLDGGRVQEEIRFTINSECVISKLFCPDQMKNNEVIFIFGSQQFFNYKGYGYKFKFNGYRNDNVLPSFCSLKPNRLISCIVGIDAIKFYNSRNQSKINMLIREIVKSYIGYSISNNDIGHKIDKISSGNWGCGVFKGDPMLKAMIQWISASLSNRNISYYTFNDKRVVNNLEPLIKAMVDAKITVGQLWDALTQSQFDTEYQNDQINVMGHLARYLKLDFL